MDAVTAFPWCNGADMLTSEFADTSTYGGVYAPWAPPSPFAVELDGYAHRPYLHVYSTEQNAKIGDTTYLSSGFTNIRAQLAGVQGGNPSWISSNGGTFYFGFSIRIPNPCEYALTIQQMRNASPNPLVYELTSGYTYTWQESIFNKWATVFELAPNIGVRSPVELQVRLDGSMRVCLSGGPGSTADHTFRLGDPVGGYTTDHDDAFFYDGMYLNPFDYPPGVANLGTYYKPFVAGSDPDLLWINQPMNGGTSVDNTATSSYGEAWIHSTGSSGLGTDTTRLYILGVHLDATDGWCEVHRWDSTGWNTIGRRERIDATGTLVNTVPVGYGGASSYQPRVGATYPGDKLWTPGSPLPENSYDRFQVWLGNGYLGDDLGDVMQAMQTQLGLPDPNHPFETEFLIGQSDQWLGRPDQTYAIPYGGY